MTTEKLYYNDSKLSHFESEVISCERSGDRYAVVLDKTAFFPEEGGQYADTGILGGASVLDVKIKDGVITHYTDAPLSGKVTGELDFCERYAKMQCHTGEHIVSGLINKHYGLNNVGFHLGHDDVTLDFDGVLDDEDLAKIEALANRAVWDNIEVRAEFPEPEVLKTLEYRSKLELTENVRIVTIEGIDVCACCAPHVERTGEIGVIKLLDMIHYKGGVRIHMLCGKRALEDYDDRHKKCRAISQKLSVKQSLVCDGVDRLFAECDTLKGELATIKRSILEEKIAKLTHTDNNIVVFESILGAELMREYAKAASEYTDGVCAVFISKAENEYTFILCSKNAVTELFNSFKEKFGARGGGNPLMISGKVKANESELREFFK